MFKRVDDLMTSNVSNEQNLVMHQFVVSPFACYNKWLIYHIKTHSQSLLIWICLKLQQYVRQIWCYSCFENCTKETEWVNMLRFGAYKTYKQLSAWSVYALCFFIFMKKLKSLNLLLQTLSNESPIELHIYILLHFYQLDIFWNQYRIS